MKYLTLFFLILVVSLLSPFSSKTFAEDADKLKRELNFEVDQADAQPTGWEVQGAGVVRDEKVVHSQKWSVRIERKTGDGGPFTGISKSLPVDFNGATISIKANLRTDAVNGFVGLFMREDDESGSVAFENMKDRQLNGSTNWHEYSVTLPLKPEATDLAFGVFVEGAGTAWVENLQLLVDDKPIWEAPKRVVAKTAIDVDHEFDAGSTISPVNLNAVQIENLVSLGKVWGFLKYHHPLITSGQRHWDYELLRILPQILKASDRESANALLHHWIRKLGAVKACQTCANLPAQDLYMPPNLSWIDDRSLLGADLSAGLKEIYVSRTPAKAQFYVKLEVGIENPKFLHEPGYEKVQFPDAGFQLLALFRFWNIVEYWSPYRDLTDNDWESVLRKNIPTIAATKDMTNYQLALMAVVAQLHDTHTNLWSSIKVRPPTGPCYLPYDLRFIDKQLVVVTYAGTNSEVESGLKPGDIIRTLDGTAVSELIKRWKPYYAASNEVTQLRDMARYITRGDCVGVKLNIQRGNQEKQLVLERLPKQQLNLIRTHDKSGETFQRLSDDIAYLKLSTIKSDDILKYLEAANGSKGLIIDIRNYPSEFVVFSLGGHLVEKETDFARFTMGDLRNPGAFYWTKPQALSATQPHYAGKLVLLVDEVSQSQAEYTTMAFRSAPGAKVIGSMTAAADGDVSTIPLPGGLQTLISGIGIFYPDKRATQRVGIIPDIEVKPTITGIRDGRDEVLEAAIAEILRK